MNKVLLGFILGISISASAVYVEKVKINNWSKNDIKEIVKDVIDDCRINNNEITC